jgi:hypothetical protein
MDGYGGGYININVDIHIHICDYMYVNIIKRVNVMERCNVKGEMVCVCVIE